MKSNLLKSIFISLILVMGVNNAWAASEGSSWYDWASSENVYFDNTNSSYSNVSMLIGRKWNYGGDGIGSSGVNFTKVANTNNLYHAATTWNHYNTLLFIDATSWGWEGKMVTERYTYANNYTNTNNIDINGTELFYAASSTKGATLNHENLSGYAALNSQQTIKSAVNGADANSKALISITSYKMTAHKTTTEQTATLGTGAKDTYITAARTATTTLTVGDVEAGYQFDGWYTEATGGTQLETKKTYTYYPTAATTVYARFSTIQHTVKFGVHSSGHGSLTAKDGSTSISSDNKVNYGSTIEFTAKPDPGYQIEGWYSKSDCTNPINNGTNDTYTVTITGGTNVYVKYVEIPVNSHNITYTEEGTGWTYGAKPTSAEEGATVTFVVNPTAGYRVDVSSDGPAPTGPNANNQYTFTMPNKDVVITVDAKPEQYTVTLNKQSGTGGASSVTATYLAAMPEITLPTRTGYTFNGYFDAASGGTKYYNADGSSAKNWDKTAATTLYAQWTANQYTITYKDQNNADFSGTHASGYPTTHTYGTATTLSTANKTGYTFDGWFTKSDCSGTAVTSLGATTYTSDITLYAKWTEIPPTTVYFKPINGWKGDNTRFAVYYWEGNTNGWIDMIEDGCTGEFYKADIPAGFTNIKFVSFPTDKENNWDYDINRTEDLKVPNDGKVLYDMASTNITTLYLNPGVWNVDGAWFPAYFFSDGEAWKKMTDENRDNIYACEIPENKKKVIFVRKNPSNQDLNFNDKWAQTGDLTIPTDGKNMFSISGWDNNGSWDKVWDNSCWTAYSAPTYTISFDRQGATTGSESVEATVGDAAPDVEIERTGYTFGGYYTEANGEGTQIIDAEGKWINGTNYVDADGNWISTDCNITFYAQWTEKLSTITIIVSEGGSVKVDGEDFVSGNTVQVGVATSKTITLHPNAGYGIAAFGVDGDAWIAGNGTYTLTAIGSGSTGTLYANFVASKYTITWNPNGGKVDPTTSSYTYNGTTVELPTPTRDEFTFVGWFTEQSGGTQITEIGTTNKPTSDVTYYAHWQGAPYTVELNQEGAAKKGSTTSVVANFEGNMPAITGDGALPTPPIGYAFMGYFDQRDGKGTQYYNADGTSANVWDKAEDATLYAYFAKAKITTINLDKTTFEPVEAGSTGFVTATPIVEPKPTGTTTICWRLLYNNGTPVEGHNASTEGCEQNQVKFSIAGLNSGTYKIEAVLRTGNNCGSGTELSTKTVNFTIASTYTITVKYTCDGKEIMAPTKIPAHVTEETEITAPEIPGYTFSKWVAGDGVTITDAQNGENTNKIIKFTAIYDGYLTAQYTTKPMVYFKNTLGWEKVYVYTFNNQIWHNGNNGTGGDSDDMGVQPKSNRKEFGEMTLVEGTDDIYFFELNPTTNYTQDNSNENYIAFSDQDMSTYNFFYGTKAVYRGDHKESLTLFIPHAEQQPVTRNNTQYYNKGIWMKYNSTESGYQLAGTVPNDDPDPEHDGWGTYGNKFTAQQPGGYTFSITKDLDANKTYEFKIKNYVYVNDWEGNAKNQWFATASQINTNACTSLPLDHEESAATRYGNIQITTNAAGEYKFTIDLSTGKVILSVEYPVAVGDYRVVYTDNAKWSDPRNAHNNTNYKWNHPSRVIKKNTTAEVKLDTISFFISREQGITYSMKFQQCTNIANNGTITWGDGANIPTLKDKGESGVYNFVVTQTANGESISMGETVEPYSGNYYIRCEAMGGKWSNYKTNSENRMTYSAFSESDANSFGDRYSHYATKYCTNGTDIRFTIANDYSPCISDTLITDIKVTGQTVTVNPFGNTENGGFLKSGEDYNANIRFMWNRKTNKISRAYVGPADANNFLVLKGNGPLDDEDVNKISSKFTDTQNWIYELNIKVKPKTLVKLYACYPKNKAESDAQYFRGTYNNNQFVEDASAVQILGGDDSNFYDMRVLYDFKTNRLMAAWMPSGNIEGEVSIDADVMILREHQKDAACITLTNDDSKLKDVKTVYGVMRFNRWVLNNRDATKSGIEYCTEKINNKDTYSANITNTHHPILEPKDLKTIYERALYFISFPFDVHLSDVFGFGTYGTHWVISTYNGLRRAEKGYFLETCYTEDCTNWDYIWDPSNFVLKANTGYLLSLDLDLMKHDNINFWLHNIENVELYFPSQSTISTIERTHYTMPALTEDYECTINFNKVGPEDPTYNPVNDHRVRDSYWRCIGVPSFANYDGSLYKTEQDADNEENPINWKTNYTWQADNAAFPFLYEWNVQDNSLQVQNTSNFDFKATFAYLVQNGNSIYWSAVNAKPSNIVARKQEAKRNYDWKITIARNGEVEDQTFVRLTDHEKVTTEFDFNQDLSKEFNYGRSDIYTLIGYEKAAANSLPLSEQTTLIPLGLSIEYNGDYTIAMPDGTANIGVTLIDTESNTRTNLSAGMEYTLTLKKGDYNNRFFIEISPIQQTPTDIEYVENSHDDQARKVLIDNILYIVRDGQIFDARGARVK